MGKLAEARQQAEISVVIDPSYVWAYVLAGDTYRLEGAFDAADAWYQKLSSLSGGTPLALKYLGMNALQRGDPIGAVAYLNQSLSEAVFVKRPGRRVFLVGSGICETDSL